MIHALLQSPSVVGAYTFTARPGDETTVDVQVTLFPRVELTAFGIAPLTSMFLFDGSNRARFDDYRNAVHDSDGLQILNGRGERLWRPLANPRMLAGIGFRRRQPEGLRLAAAQAAVRGLPGRGGAVRSPAVAVGGAERRSGAPGHVELVEIPSPREMNDNIVAYWQPARRIPAGQRAEFSYRLRFTAEPLDDSLARVRRDARRGAR